MGKKDGRARRLATLPDARGVLGRRPQVAAVPNDDAGPLYVLSVLSARDRTRRDRNDKRADIRLTRCLRADIPGEVRQSKIRV